MPANGLRALAITAAVIVVMAAYAAAPLAFAGAVAVAGAAAMVLDERRAAFRRIGGSWLADAPVPAGRRAAGWLAGCTARAGAAVGRLQPRPRGPDAPVPIGETTDYRATLTPKLLGRRHRFQIRRKADGELVTSASGRRTDMQQMGGEVLQELQQERDEDVSSPCPECGASLGSRASTCRACRAEALRLRLPTPPGTPQGALMEHEATVGGGDWVTVELADDSLATGVVHEPRSGRGSFRMHTDDGREVLAHVSDIRQHLGVQLVPPPTTDRSTSNDRTIKEAVAMTTNTNTNSGADGLGTAGRASISGLVIDWESSVEARAHPETFVAWLQAQAVAARQRAAMVPDLVDSYHGRGPSGHAGVPDAQISAFSQRYAESATAEAEAYERWAGEYAAYWEHAREQMTHEYGKEVVRDAAATHAG